MRFQPVATNTRGRSTINAHPIVTKRVYDQPSRSDGTRVLVDRVWPRGLTKEAAELDEWCKDVAPSTELRQWYGHTPDKFPQFRRQYLAELDDSIRAQALAHLRDLAQTSTLTLLTASKTLEISHARVLADVL